MKYIRRQSKKIYKILPRSASKKIAEQKDMPTAESVYYIKLNDIAIEDFKQFPFYWEKPALMRNDIFVPLKETDIKSDNDD